MYKNQALTNIEEIHRPEVPVFLGGHASVKVHDSLRRYGVNLRGTNLNKELTRFQTIVPID